MLQQRQLVTTTRWRRLATAASAAVLLTAACSTPNPTGTGLEGTPLADVNFGTVTPAPADSSDQNTLSMPTFEPPPLIPTLSEPACTEAGNALIFGNDLVPASAGEATHELISYVHDHMGDLLGWYYNETTATFVIVAAPDALAAVEETLPLELQGPLSQLPFDVALQEGCVEISELRALRDQVSTDPVLLAAFKQRGMGGGIAFNIDAATGRLVISLPDDIDVDTVGQHLLDRFGADRVEIAVWGLLAG